SGAEDRGGRQRDAGGGADRHPASPPPSSSPRHHSPVPPSLPASPSSPPPSSSPPLLRLTTDGLQGAPFGAPCSFFRPAWVLRWPRRYWPACRSRALAARNRWR